MDTTDTTTDPYDLLIDGILSAQSLEGQELFCCSIDKFAKEAGEDPFVATNVVGTLVDIIDMLLMERFDDLEDRVEIVRIYQAVERNAAATLNQLADLARDMDA